VSLRSLLNGATGAGGMMDHVHVLPSTITLADIASAMKAHSSGWIHQTFPNHRASAWQNGYDAFSVSKSVKAQVREYIRSQTEHHRNRSFQEEYLEFLKKREIEYDERYLGD
jgi:REP element-mobilizing transposase RayT